MRILDGLHPNRSVTARIFVAYAIASLAAFVCAWQLATISSPGTLPAPAEVLSALATLWNERGLFDQLSSSLALNLEAIAVSTAITLVLAYATVIPVMRPVVAGLTKLRFTGMVGWGFVLTLATSSGHQLKLWMLVFGMTPFFLTAMAAVVAEIPKERFDHARTLGMSEWRVVWEVVIRGTADKAFETLRQNAAMGWMMLTTVEGVVRSEGGIGTMLLDENKHLALDAMFALILVVMVVGVAQDYALAYLRRAVCPYADLAKERR